jgi:hypothetical protein
VLALRVRGAVPRPEQLCDPRGMGVGMEQQRARRVAATLRERKVHTPGETGWARMPLGTSATPHSGTANGTWKDLSAAMGTRQFQLQPARPNPT